MLWPLAVHGNPGIQESDWEHASLVRTALVHQETRRETDTCTGHVEALTPMKCNTWVNWTYKPWRLSWVCLVCKIRHYFHWAMIITAHKRSLRRLCFYTCLSVFLFTVGEYLGRYPPGQVHPPLGRYMPQQCILGYGSTSGRYASYWNAFLLQIRLVESYAFYTTY